jgi:peptide deformylase
MEWETSCSTVGKAIRIFVIDTTPFSDDEDLDLGEQKKLNGFKRTFINAKNDKEEGEEWSFRRFLVCWRRRL